MISPAVRYLLEDIRDYGREAIEITGGRTTDQILEERLREHGVLRTVQVVGEAASQILKLRPEGIDGLELREASRVRNILVHGYGKIRLAKIVEIVADDLPGLIAAAERLLGETE